MNRQYSIRLCQNVFLDFWTGKEAIDYGILGFSHSEDLCSWFPDNAAESALALRSCLLQMMANLTGHQATFQASMGYETLSRGGPSLFCGSKYGKLWYYPGMSPARKSRSLSTPFLSLLLYSRGPYISLRSRPAWAPFWTRLTLNFVVRIWYLRRYMISGIAF